jgi:hypothetical protein
MGKEEPRTADTAAMPTVIAATVDALEEENKPTRARKAPHRRWLHCKQDNNNTTIARMTDAMLAAAAEQSKLPRVMFIFY